MVTRRRGEKKTQTHSHHDGEKITRTAETAQTWTVQEYDDHWMNAENAVNNSWTLLLLIYDLFILFGQLQSHRIFSHIAGTLLPWSMAIFSFLLCTACAWWMKKKNLNKIIEFETNTSHLKIWDVSCLNCTYNIFGSSFFAHIHNHNFYYLFDAQNIIIIKTPGTRQTHNK